MIHALLEVTPIRIAGLGVSALSFWGAYHSYKTGKVVYRIKPIAERANDPVMFWIYVAVMIAIGIAGATMAFGLIK